MKILTDIYHSIKKNTCRIVFTALFLIILIPSSVYAQTSYVLPYPSQMPGSSFYKLNLVKEKIFKYWYFGDFGQFNYNLKMTDKYLVEAKTLFEYRQYLLGHRALKKSDQYFVNVLPSLVRAERNGKNTLQKRAVLNEASQKHIEVIRKMKNSTPGALIWKPEKSAPTSLDLKKAFNESVHLREKNI